MKKKWMIFGSIVIVVLLVLTTFHFYQPFDITKTPFDVVYADEFTMVRRVIPGPAQKLVKDGNYIVAVGQSPIPGVSDCALYLYNINNTPYVLEDDTCSVIATSTMGWFHNVSIEGDYVLYLDNTGWSECNPLSLRAYQISTQTIQLISPYVSDFQYDIDGTKVVFPLRNQQTDSQDIALYDLTTGTTSLICTAVHAQDFPYINGNIVTWRDLRNKTTTGYDLYMYNLFTQSESTVTTALGDQFCSEMNDEYIVYTEDLLPNTTNLKIFHISSGTTTLIYSIDGSMYTSLAASSLSSHYLLYQLMKSGSNGGIDEQRLYLYDISTTSAQLIEELTGLQGEGSCLMLEWDLSEDYIAYGGWTGVKVYNRSTGVTTTLRSTGYTEWVHFNTDENSIIMNTKGTNDNPNEWDVSLVQLP
jgi:hypothetical protein